jgi:anti-sigma regulatory factor (Ser/Thr protein kinase)
MSLAPAHGDIGYQHEMFVYDSDEELLEFLVPFLREASDSGEPAFTALPDHEAALVRRALGHGVDVTFLPPLTRSTPTSAIKAFRSLLGEHVVGRTRRRRVANIVPHPGLGAPWHPWSRYEAAINDLLADLPVWGVCLYDRRYSPDHVLADAARTHPHVRGRDGSSTANVHYQLPQAFLASMPPPSVELVDPSPASARRSVDAAAQLTALDHDTVDNLKLAVSESISNAIIHGRPPVTMQLWTAPQRIVITITDQGDGPQDPYAGLRPRPPVDGHLGGYGLWITHQLANVALLSATSGFRVRLIGGQAIP